MLFVSEDDGDARDTYWSIRWWSNIKSNCWTIDFRVLVCLSWWSYCSMYLESLWVGWSWHILTCTQMIRNIICTHKKVNVMLLKLFIFYLYSLSYKLSFLIKGALSGLRKFLANKSLLKMMKIPFYYQGNQTIKFSQFIEHKMRNIFLEKSYAKCVWETNPRSFSKKSKLVIFLEQ